jgi:hypothetical protein
MIKDTGDKLSASDKQAIEAAMEAVKKAGEGTDAGEVFGKFFVDFKGREKQR